MARAARDMLPGSRWGHWEIIREVEKLPTRNARRFLARADCGKEATHFGFNLVANAHRPSCNSCKGARPSWTPEERAARAAALPAQRAERKATWVRCEACHGVVKNTPDQRARHLEEMHDGAEVRFGRPMADDDEDDSDEEAA